MSDDNKDSEKQIAIEQFRNSTISMFKKLKGVNFELMKSEIAKHCKTNLSVVKDIIDADVVCGEGGTTLESIINDGNSEIQKIIDSVVITDEELEEVKKSMLDKINFEMGRGEFILYQKTSEIITAYLSIHGIANATKNSLLEALPHLINQDKNDDDMVLRPKLTVGEMRKLDQQVTAGIISYSRMVEIINGINLKK